MRAVIERLARLKASAPQPEHLLGGARSRRHCHGHGKARELHLWVSTQARLYPPVEDPAGEAGPPPAAGMSGLEQSLVDAGLRAAVSSLSNQGADRVALRFDRVAFGRFMPWFAGLADTAGYTPESFSIESLGAPGYVAVALVLEPGA